MPRIDRDKQGKHQPGHRNYIAGRSILDVEPDVLLPYLGVATPVVGDPPEPGSKSRLILPFVIGRHCDFRTRVLRPSTVAIVYYAKGGIHFGVGQPLDG